MEKSSQIFSKITNDLISPLENFKESLVKIYNENLEEISKEFNNTQVEQQRENREILEIMKDTIQSIYKNVEQLQTISLVK